MSSGTAQAPSSAPARRHFTHRDQPLDPGVIGHVFLLRRVQQLLRGGGHAQGVAFCKLVVRQMVIDAQQGVSPWGGLTPGSGLAPEQQKLQQRFLRMQAVFRFIPNHSIFVIQHIFRDFFTAVRRQAVHE